MKKVKIFMIIGVNFSFKILYIVAINQNYFAILLRIRTARNVDHFEA